jgi:transketolase
MAVTQGTLFQAQTMVKILKKATDSGAIGMAAIGVALWKYVMRYAPHTPDYFNRDRFVLSNGKQSRTGECGKDGQLTC